MLCMMIVYAGVVTRCQVRYIFSFADTHQQLSLDEEEMRKLLSALYMSAKGLGAPAALLSSVSKMKKNAAGRIPLTEFNKFCSSAPSLLFPLARMQQEMANIALGMPFWQDKKGKYVEQRRLAIQARDLGMVTGGSDADPAIVQAMYLEMLCERSSYVAQAFTEATRAGIVAVFVANPTAVQKYAETLPKTKVCAAPRNCATCDGDCEPPPLNCFHCRFSLGNKCLPATSSCTPSCLMCSSCARMQG